MELYIDPGTGSMLFAIFIGIAGALGYAVKSSFVKLKFILSGGKVEANDEAIPLAIFSDDKRYWNVFEPVCREFDRRGIPVVYLTASSDDPAFDSAPPLTRVSYLGDGNKAFAKLNLLKASIVLSTTPGLDVYQWKRSKDTKYYVHILHAAGEVTLYRMFGLDYYDAVLVAGDRQVSDIRALEELRGLPAKELPFGGIPFMDEMAARLAACDPLEHHERTVLLAPSWGSSSIFSKHGSRIIGDLVDTGYHVIVRPHPQSFKSEAALIDGIMRDFPESEHVEWNRDVDNFECLRRADILISDFSGVIFEFALVYDKPVIYTDPAFDLDPYDAWWLDGTIWTLDALPKIGMSLDAKADSSLRELIDACIEDPAFARGRDELRDEVWQRRGTGAVDTVDYLVGKLEELSGDDEPAEADELPEADGRSGAEEPASGLSNAGEPADIDEPADMQPGEDGTRAAADAAEGSR